MVTAGFDFDHTSIGVEDAAQWGRWIRRELGGVVITGQEMADMRYVMFHVGDAAFGGRLELIGPGSSESFMTRFLRTRGPGFHHITFMVPDVEEVARAVTELGLTVVGVNLHHPPWREVFIAPDPIHGVVIQLADSTLEYPPLEALLATPERDVTGYPHNAGQINDDWWQPLWTERPLHRAAIRSTSVVSTDTEISRKLFGTILGADMSHTAGSDHFRWPGGCLDVVGGTKAGVARITLTGRPAADFFIGSAQLRFV